MRSPALVALLLATGCLSWRQADAPPREDWDRVETECGASVAPAGVALLIAALAGGGAAVIVATTEPDSGGVLGGDFGEHVLGGLLVPVSIGYGIDAVNAWGEARDCREYRQHRRELGQSESDHHALPPALPGGRVKVGDRPRRDQRLVVLPE